MGVRDDVEALVSFEGRAPGTDAERRAARHLERRLRELGREAEAEAIDTWPRWPVAYLALIVLAVVGSVLSVAAPLVAAALMLVALVLFALDSSGLLPLARRAFGRRASQNVVSREGGDKPGTLVLVAHYDAGPMGAAFHRALAERRATLARLIRRPFGLIEPVLAAMAVVLVCCVLRAIGVESWLLSLIQFVPTAGLTLTAPLLADVALAEASPGANDNASGVAVALRLLERYGGSLEHFGVWGLFPGAQEALADGTRAFVRRHRRALDAGRTVFLNLDELGAGSVRYTRREGLAPAVRSHSQLVDLCDEIAEDDSKEGAFAARGIVNRAPSDATAARAAGFPAITITCRNALDYVPQHHQPEDTPERLDQDALERAYGFCCQLVERLDATVGRELRQDRDLTALSEPESS